MEELTQHIYPQLARIVNQYNPPQALLIIQYKPESGAYRYINLNDSEIVDTDWARTIQLVQRKHPDTEIVFYTGIDFNVPIKDFDIRIVEDPELIDAFGRIYGKSFSSYRLEYWFELEIKRLYRELTGIYPEGDKEDYDPAVDDIELSGVSKYFLSQ